MHRPQAAGFLVHWQARRHPLEDRSCFATKEARSPFYARSGLKPSESIDPHKIPCYPKLSRFDYRLFGPLRRASAREGRIVP